MRNPGRRAQIVRNPLVPAPDAGRPIHDRAYCLATALAEGRDPSAYITYVNGLGFLGVRVDVERPARGARPRAPRGPEDGAAGG